MEFRIIEKSISYVQDEEYCIVMGRSHKCIRRTTGDTLTPGRQIGTEGSGIAVGELVVATLFICVVNSHSRSWYARFLA
jgi:hypothetical protein